MNTTPKGTMKKEMEQVSVEAREGLVKIEQPDPSGNQDSIILLNPHQIDTLIKWLKEAKAIALQGEESPKTKAKTKAAATGRNGAANN